MSVDDDIARLTVERNEASKLVMDKTNGGRQGQFVVFMTPSYSGDVTMGFLKSFYESAVLLAQAGIGCDFQSFIGDPYLAKVRNGLVSTCLRNCPQATDFFFLDADIEWDAAAVLRVVKRPEPIVAGIYPKKNDTVEFPATLRVAELVDGVLPVLPPDREYRDIRSVDPETQELVTVPGKFTIKGDLVLAELVPTGFLRVKRHVYEEMCEISATYVDGTSGNQTCWNLFECGFHKETGQWWGEDYAWCKRAQAMGYDLWIDPDIQFGHRGGKTWRNNFNFSLLAASNGGAVCTDDRQAAD